jgi:hypothetical protein
MDGKENDTYLLHRVPIDANVHGYFARKAAEPRARFGLASRGDSGD